jgi:hypothetical protein
MDGALYLPVPLSRWQNHQGNATRWMSGWTQKICNSTGRPQ